jgi:SAM-dependent methyltransferase
MTSEPTGPSTAEQQRAAAEKNKSFFSGNEEYARAIGELDTYRNVRDALNREVQGIGTLLDVGNGGTFDYSPELVERIIAVDLFLDDVTPGSLPPNVEARQGDALDLDEPDGEYEAVLMALLLHHLVGERPSDLVTNARRAIAEAARVLRPGGRLILVESCVPPWFYRVEQVLFWPLSWLAGTRLMAHPATLQPSPPLLHRLVSQYLSIEHDEAIPTGRWILQFGKRWPTALTPARMRLIVAHKPG